MKSHLLKFKANLKKQAQEIRELKPKRKGAPNGYVPELEGIRCEYRIGHIAYCLLRGRTKEQIEPKWRDPNDYTHKYVWEKAKKIVARVQEEAVDEIICSDS